MIWAWLAVVGLAVGLPAAAWRLSRNLKPPRQRAGHLGFDRIDRWLAERYGLGALERLRIQETIFYDARKLDDPRLRAAARGLAEELLSGRLRPVWLIRMQGWIMGLVGVGLIAAGIITHDVHPSQGVLSICYFIEGFLGVILGAAVTIWTPNQLRRNLTRLIEEDADGPSAS